MVPETPCVIMLGGDTSLLCLKPAHLVTAQPHLCPDRRPFVVWARETLSGDVWILIWG
jgi:hypothetical protein